MTTTLQRQSVTGARRAAWMLSLVVACSEQAPATSDAGMNAVLTPAEPNDAASTGTGELDAGLGGGARSPHDFDASDQLPPLGGSAETGVGSAPQASPSVETDAATASELSPAPTSCDSTWQAIQSSIFAAKGCAAATCHNEHDRAGRLDLDSPGVLRRLIHTPAQASLTSAMDLVVPGEQALSFLYLKLAAAADPALLPPGGGSPMPLGKTPLTQNQLLALRLWIRAGAPERGVVAGTQSLLSCAQPAEADPNKAPQPPIPSAALGFQHAAGPWTVKAGSESEVCFATYYDLTDSAPAWAQLPCTIDGRAQTCVGVDRRSYSQDAQSHHGTATIYAGAIAPTDPAWGAWLCAGGERAGTPCDPTVSGQCGERGVCQATPRAMAGCTGYGPNDKERSSVPAGGGQSPLNYEDYPAGVYAQLPLRGVVLWNSHGFNLTLKDTTIEQYNTFWYARPDERVYPLHDLFTAGEGVPNANIVIDVPPYEQREYCSLYTLPRHARLVALMSHVHKRSLLWRTWLPPHPVACPPGGCRPDDVEPVHKSVLYNDPVVRRFDPPLVFDQEDAEARTLKFCSVYDNGKAEPSLLKRKSELPVGAACQGPLYCAGGEHPGQVCSADTDCGSGRCDACRVSWGVTTEDEMFFLVGSYFVAPPTP